MKFNEINNTVLFANTIRNLMDSSMSPEERRAAFASDVVNELIIRGGSRISKYYNVDCEDKNDVKITAKDEDDKLAVWEMGVEIYKKDLNITRNDELLWDIPLSRFEGGYNPEAFEHYWKHACERVLYVVEQMGYTWKEINEQAKLEAEAVAKQYA